MSEVGSRVRVLMSPPGLALVALLLATGALIADSVSGDARAGAPARPAGTGGSIAALELARWIRDGRPGLRLLDVRSPAEFDEYHIATAANLPLADVTDEPTAGESEIVVYDEAGEPGGDAERAARILSRAEGTDVRVLAGGIIAWTDEVLRPTIAANAPAAERARFEETAALSRWFDGLPRVVPAGGSVKTAGPAARESRMIRRQGC